LRRFRKSKTAVVMDTTPLKTEMTSGDMVVSSWTRHVAQATDVKTCNSSAAS
jgi:hypothetical protein